MKWLPGAFDPLDVRKARELVDGHVTPDAPHLDLGEPSWFATDIERRRYWYRHAADIVVWARERSLGHPVAALRYGTPMEAHRAIWSPVSHA